MLGSQNDALHPGFLTYPGPLQAIQFSGIEQFRRFPAQAPFHIGEGVHVEMHKSIEFHLVP